MKDYSMLSFSKPRQALYKCKRFFTHRIPSAFKNFFLKFPSAMRKLFRKLFSPFRTLKDAMVYGSWQTRISFVFMGSGLLLKKRFLKGALYLIFEIIFILFFSLFGWKYLSNLGTLGTKTPTEVWDETQGVYVKIAGDNSMLILLYSVITIIAIIGFIYTWYRSIKEVFETEKIQNINGQILSSKGELKTYLNSNYHLTLLFGPMAGLVLFTIVPLIFMIFIAFTSWDKASMPPEHLFTWVGTKNFDILLGGKGMGENAAFTYTFYDALLWTLVWAFFATFTNFFLGMIVALLINKKSIKYKKFWRTILITSIAVPQFVSLMLVSSMFGSDGIGTWLLRLIGINKTFAQSTLFARIFVIVVNIWVGIPYTVLSTTGILMNIPNDLYESAKIDGASPFKMYTSITLPYIMFVMGPYLISQFVGNINNFNVIFLLTGGVPVNSDKFIAGDTDLLVTWLYKLTVNENNYKMASTIGIIVFIVVAFISLIFYSKTSSVKNEGDFN